MSHLRTTPTATAMPPSEARESMTTPPKADTPLRPRTPSLPGTKHHPSPNHLGSDRPLVVAGFEGVVLTGSADGTIKCFRRELIGGATRHVLVQVLAKQEHAVTALAVTVAERVVYGGSSNGLVNFWEREKHFMAHGGVLCLEAVGRQVLSGSTDEHLRVEEGQGRGQYVPQRPNWAF
ncbi:hypothetical protein Acr_00g0072860 [Actinidia rufa]|uniref:Uncharacterized protein n=1 Tax=Actinidia rufa TaxID=165716 RepID=A0A7J0DS60_9ERIC|nr:hypothetical protein Acr_00g0072860 [Actinidia rufa]